MVGEEEVADGNSARRIEGEFHIIGELFGLGKQTVYANVVVGQILVRTREHVVG